MNWNSFFNIALVLARALPTLGLPTLDSDVVTDQAEPKYVFAHFMVSRIPSRPSQYTLLIRA